MTRRFFERIAALCTKLPVWTVAKMGRLSWDTVARVDKRAIELALGDREHALKGLRWIGVDEVSRTGGRVYFTVVTNLKTGRVKLGLVESINSKIAALRVQARGYRDPEYFKLKIFQRCALPDNPWAQIVL